MSEEIPADLAANQISASTNAFSTRLIDGGDLLKTLVVERCGKYKYLGNILRTFMSKLELSAEVNCKGNEIGQLLLDYASKLVCDDRYMIIKRQFCHHAMMIIPLSTVNDSFKDRLTKFFLRNVGEAFIDDRLMMMMLMTSELIVLSLGRSDIERAGVIYHTTMKIVRPSEHTLDNEFTITAAAVIRWMTISKILIDPDRIADLVEEFTIIELPHEMDIDKGAGVATSDSLTIVLPTSAEGHTVSPPKKGMPNIIKIIPPNSTGKVCDSTQNKGIPLPKTDTATKRESITSASTIEVCGSAQYKKTPLPSNVCELGKRISVLQSEHKKRYAEFEETIDETVSSHLNVLYTIVVLSLKKAGRNDSQVKFTNILHSVNIRPRNLIELREGIVLRDYAEKVMLAPEYKMIRHRFLTKCAGDNIAEYYKVALDNYLSHDVMFVSDDDRVMVAMVLTADLIVCLTFGNSVERAMLIFIAGLKILSCFTKSGILLDKRNKFSAGRMRNWVTNCRALTNRLRKCTNISDINPTLTSNQQGGSQTMVSAAMSSAPTPTTATNVTQIIYQSDPQSSPSAWLDHDSRVINKKSSTRKASTSYMLEAYLSKRMRDERAILLWRHISYSYAQADLIAMIDFGDEIANTEKYENISQSFLLQLSKSADKAKAFQNLIKAYMLPFEEVILFDRIMMVALLAFELIDDLATSGSLLEAVEVCNVAVKCYCDDYYTCTTTKSVTISGGWEMMSKLQERLVNRTEFNLLNDFASFLQEINIPPLTPQAITRHELGIKQSRPFIDLPPLRV